MPALTNISVGSESGTSDALFTVTLSRPSGLVATVEYSTSDGTAVAAEIHLGNESGRSLILQVLPLANRVRILDEE